VVIKFAEAEFGTLTKQDGMPVEKPLPDVLPPWNPSPPRIVPENERANYFGQMVPRYASFNRNSEEWEVVANLPYKPAPTIMLAGENFVVTEKGLYQSKDGETPNKKISSVALAITKMERRWSGKKIKEILHVEVSCSDEQGTVSKIIKVPTSDFKKIFETIRREFPSAYTSLGDFDAKEEYLTEVYRRDAAKAVVEYHSDLEGWVEFEEITPQFYVGEDRFYAEMRIALPNVAYANRHEIFIEGSRFRQIGNENCVIEILWLVAHIALSLFWMRKFGVDFRSVVFLKGKSNLFKTTVVSFLANIFAKNRRKASIRLSSTKAYAQEFVTKMRDQYCSPRRFF